MDDDGVLLMHNHPWPWSFSIILAGGYEEERTDEVFEVNEIHPANAITKKKFTAGSFNFLTHKDFHRVDLLEKDGWSLFFTGWRSSKRSWGFWNRRRNQYREWTTMPKAIA